MYFSLVKCFKRLTSQRFVHVNCVKLLVQKYHNLGEFLCPYRIGFFVVLATGWHRYSCGDRKEVKHLLSNVSVILSSLQLSSNLHIFLNAQLSRDTDYLFAMGRRSSYFSCFSIFLLFIFVAILDSPYLQLISCFSIVVSHSSDVRKWIHCNLFHSETRFVYITHLQSYKQYENLLVKCCHWTSVKKGHTKQLGTQSMNGKFSFV